MPFLAPVASAVVGAIGGVLTAGGIVGTIARGVLYAVASYGLSKLTKPKLPQAAPDQGLELTKRIRTDHPIEVLFGETATPGSLMWWGVRGNDNEFFEQVLSLSDYTCDSVQRVFGDGKELTFSSSLTAGYAPCTSHYLDEDGNSCLFIKVFLGDPSQTADSDLVSNYSEITSNFRGRGRAYAITRMKWNRDAFPNGEPQLLFVMRGAPVYDPRLDDTVTGGSGSHRSNDPTTWEWTANPALIGAQYLQGWSLNGSVHCGMGYSRTRIPDADLIEAANECEEQINLNGGGTEDQYQAHGSFLVGKSGRSHQSNMEMILAACDGELDDGGGREFRIIPGVERTPVSMTIAWDDIQTEGGIQLEPNLEPAQRINSVLGQFTDPDAVYQLGDVPLRQVAAYVTEDNGQEYYDEPTLLAVTSYTQAQRVLKRRMERARAERRVSLTLPLEYAQLEKGDRVNFDATLESRLGLPDTVWRVEQRPQILPDLNVELVFREHPDSIGDWTPATDELSRTNTAISGSTLTSLTLSGATATAVEVTEGNAKIPVIRVAWTADNPQVNVAIILTRLDGASPPAPVSPAQVITVQAVGSDASVDIPVTPGAQYKVEYRVLFAGRVSGLTTIEAALTATGTLEATAVTAGGVSGLGALATLDTVSATEIDANAVTTAKLAASAVETAKIAANAVTNADSTTSTGNRSSAAFTEFELVRHTQTLTSGTTAILQVFMNGTDLLSSMGFTISVSSGNRDIYLRLIRDPDGTPVELKTVFLRENQGAGPDSYTVDSYSTIYEDTGHGGGSTTYAWVVTSYTAGTTTLNSSTLSHTDITRTIYCLEAKR